MKRKIVRTVKTGAIASAIAGLFLASASTFAAPLPGTPHPAPKGKEMYSSRPKNYTPPTMLGPVFESDPWQAVPSEVVVADGPVAAAPRLTPMPAPVLPRDVNSGARRTLEYKPTLAKAPGADTEFTPFQTVKPEPIVITEQSEKRPISSVEVGGTPLRPKAVPVPVDETPKNDDGAAVLNFAPRKEGTGDTDQTGRPLIDPDNTAQMGRPLVDPSREESYWKNVPVAEPVNDLDDFNARLAKIQLEKHNLAETLTLIEKIKSPNYKVKTLVDLAEYVSRDSGYKREADTLYALAVDGIEALDAGKPVVVKMPNTPVRTAPKAAPPKKTIPTLIEEKAPETPTLAPQPKPAIEPVVPQSSRTPTLLDEEPVVKKDEPKAVLPTTTAAPESGAGSRRPSILMTEEPKAEEKKSEPTVLPMTPTEKREEEPAAAPKSTKRPMPGKRTLTLEAN